MGLDSILLPIHTYLELERLSTGQQNLSRAGRISFHQLLNSPVEVTLVENTGRIDPGLVDEVKKLQGTYSTFKGVRERLGQLYRWRLYNDLTSTPEVYPISVLMQGIYAGTPKELFEGTYGNNQISGSTGKCLGKKIAEIRFI